jgi:hypothetical protein
MSNIDRDVVKPPNLEHPGDRRSNTYLPLVGTPSGRFGLTAEIMTGDRPSTLNPVTLETSPVKPPDHRFCIGTAGAGESRCAVAPGHGVIPVEPSSVSTRIVDDGNFGNSRERG